MKSSTALLEQLRDSLEELPGLRTTLPQGVDPGVDLWVHAESGCSVALQVKVVGQGYPRDIRQAAEALERTLTGDRFGLVGSSALSPGSRKMLQERGIGYWDAGGSLYLRLPWGLYLVDRPAPRTSERRGRELFRGASSQVLHALLEEPGRLWRGADLARAAEVSKATVSRVLELLERNLWGQREGGGSRAPFRLERPQDLLEAWSRAHSLQEYRWLRFHAPVASQSRLEQSAKELLQASGAAYALTLESGAARRAPFTSGSRHLAALVEEGTDWQRLVAAGDFRPVDRGENLLLLETRDPAPLKYREELDGFWVASPVQLYLDLQAWPRRGPEQAAHLREVCLGY